MHSEDLCEYYSSCLSRFTGSGFISSCFISSSIWHCEQNHKSSARIPDHYKNPRIHLAHMKHGSIDYTDHNRELHQNLTHRWEQTAHKDLGGTLILYSVLQSSSSVKMEVKGQPPKNGWSKVKLPFGWTRVNFTFYLEYGYYTS